MRIDDGPLLATRTLVVACGLAFSGCYLSHETPDSSTPGDTRPPDRRDSRPPDRDGGSGCGTPPFRRLDVTVSRREPAPSTCRPTAMPGPDPDCSFGPSTRACGSLAGTTGADRFAAAARGDALAVAWTTDGAPMTSFALFDRTFVGPARCFATEEVLWLSLATTPSGFLVAITRPSEVELHPLSMDGSPSGPIVVVPDLREAKLISRPDGGPLLTGVKRNDLNVLLLEDDGTPRWRTEFFDTALEAHLGSGAYPGGRFLVAMRHLVEARIGVATIELDGTVSCVQMPSPESTEYPQLAWDGERGSITWADFGGGTKMTWAGIDAEGALVAGPVEIVGRDRLFNPAPNVGIDGVSYVLSGTHTGTTYLANRLELHRLDTSGSAIYPAEDVAEYPRSVSVYRMLRWNADLVALWVRAGPIDEPLGVALLATAAP